MPALPELLGIEGSTVSVDAMHTQRATTETITARGGACVLALKGNQETLHDDVRLHKADPENAEKMIRFNDVDKGHRRIEIREATVCHDIDTLVDLHHWAGLQAVGKLTATREFKGERSTGTRFFLLSERLDPERLPRTSNNIFFNIRIPRALWPETRGACGAVSSVPAFETRGDCCRVSGPVATFTALLKFGRGSLTLPRGWLPASLFASKREKEPRLQFRERLAP